MTADLGASSASMIRPLTADDVEALVELNTLCEIAEAGHPDHEVLSWIRDGADDYASFGIFDEHGLAAGAWIDTEPSGHKGFEGDVRVRPGLDKGLGDPLLDAIRAVAAAAEPDRPLHFFANASADRARDWMESRGGTLLRHFWRMRIDLDEAALAPVSLPAGVTLRSVNDDESDLRTVFQVVDTSFKDHFGSDGSRTYEQWLISLRKRSNLDFTLWWIAELDGAPASALLGWRLPDHECEWTGHVGTLGTLREARGRGVGSALLRTAFAEFAARGLRKATLGVDAANATGAVRLYESAGMHADHEWVLYEIPTATTAAGPRPPGR